jgi:hypothetical protein
MKCFSIWIGEGGEETFNLHIFLLNSHFWILISFISNLMGGFSYICCRVLFYGMNDAYNFLSAGYWWVVLWWLLVRFNKTFFPLIVASLNYNFFLSAFMRWCMLRLDKTERREIMLGLIYKTIPNKQPYLFMLWMHNAFFISKTQKILFSSA